MPSPGADPKQVLRQPLLSVGGICILCSTHRAAEVLTAGDLVFE